MKLAIGRNELLAGVQAVIGAVGSRKSLEVLTFIHARGDGETIFLTATDLETTLVSRLAHPHEPFETLLPAKRLYDVLRAFQDGSVVGLEEKDGKTILKSGRSRFQLALLDPQDFPILNEMEFEQSFTVQQATLLSMMNAADYAMADKDVRYYLCGLLLELSDKFTMVSTDGHRLAKVDEHITVPTTREEPLQVIIPKHAASELKKLLNEKDDCTLFFSKNHFRVEFPHSTFVTKLIDGWFPDYQRVIPRSLDYSITINRQLFLDTLNRVRLVLESKEGGMRFEFDENTLTMTSVNHGEQAEEVLETDCIANTSVGLNPRYLVDVLRAMQSENVCFHFKDHLNAVLLEGIEQQDGTHVVMPMRL